MIQLLINPIPISGDVRIIMSVVVLSIIVLGMIFIPKAMKYRKRLLETEPEELEKENNEDIVMMIVDEKETTATDETEPDNQA